MFIAGGIGLAPVRCVIWNALDLSDQFQDITIVYGARSVADLVYKRELEEWAKRSDVQLHQCVDPGGETPDWKGEVCFVPVAGGEGLALAPRRLCDCLRPAHHDHVHPAAPGEAGLCCGPRLHHAREPDEMRARQVRPLQCRLGLRLQGRPGVHRRPAEDAPAGILVRKRRGAGSAVEFADGAGAGAGL